MWVVLRICFQRVKYRGGNLSGATPGKPFLTRMVKVNLIHHSDCVHLPRDTMRMSLHLCDCPPLNPLSWSNYEKNKANVNWRICSKILGQHASKLPRSSKTRKVWETVRAQERWRRCNREWWCGFLDGILQLKEDARAQMSEIRMNCGV